MGKTRGKNTAQEFTIIVPGIIDLLLIQFFRQAGIVHPNCSGAALLFFFP